MSQNGKLVLVIAVLALVILIMSYFIWNNSSNSTDSNTNGSGFEQVEMDNDSEQDKTEEIKKEDTKLEEEKKVEEKPVTNTDSNNGSTELAKFSQSKQTLGVDSSKDEYKIVSFLDSDKSSYRRFTFRVEFTGADKNSAKLPLTVAEYRSDLSSVRLNFSDISNDSSGIGYQASKDINVKGIVRVYHAITGVVGDSTYDIGTSKATKFYLTSTEISKGVWDINLDVEYPGTTSGSSVDLGSTTFSKTKQVINGAKTSDGASASGFSYSASGGVFQLVLTVNGSSTKPIPDSYAEYSGGKLQLVLTDSSDIFGNGKEYDLPSVGKLKVLRSGNQSTYIMENVSDKEFKLYGTQAPNQIILEVKL